MIGIFNTILIQNLKLNAFMPNYSHLSVFAYSAEIIAEIWKSVNCRSLSSPNRKWQWWQRQ